MAAPISPPAYTSVDVQPPAYHNGANQIAIADRDVKHPINEETSRELQPAVSTSAPNSRELASVSSSLQPFSKLRHPTSTPIPENSWNEFVADLRNSVAPSGGEKALAILAGTGVALGCWAPLGMCVGGLIWKKAIEKRIRGSLESLEEAAYLQAPVKPADGRETITQVVDRYNALWAPLGVCVRLEGITKKEGLAGLTCHCDQRASRRSGCGGCCGRRCGSCGKWRNKQRSDLKSKVRRDIIKVSVESQPTMTEVVRNREQEEGSNKEEWVDLKGY